MNTKSAVATLVSNLSSANKSIIVKLGADTPLSAVWDIAKNSEKSAMMYIWLAYAPGNYYENQRRWTGILPKKLPVDFLEKLGYTVEK